MFDNNLVLRAIYDNIGTSGVCVSPGPHQYLFTSNSNPNGNGPGTWENTGEIYKMELDGTILGRFGHASKEFGGFQVVHMMDCRNPDQILVAEIESWRVQKLMLQPQAAKVTAEIRQERLFTTKLREGASHRLTSRLRPVRRAGNRVRFRSAEVPGKHPPRRGRGVATNSGACSSTRHRTSDDDVRHGGAVCAAGRGCPSPI